MNTNKSTHLLCEWEEISTKLTNRTCSLWTSVFQFSWWASLKQCSLFDIIVHIWTLFLTTSSFVSRVDSVYSIGSSGDLCFHTIIEAWPYHQRWYCGRFQGSVLIVLHVWWHLLCTRILLICVFLHFRPEKQVLGCLLRFRCCVPLQENTHSCEFLSYVSCPYTVELHPFSYRRIASISFSLVWNLEVNNPFSCP